MLLVREGVESGMRVFGEAFTWKPRLKDPSQAVDTPLQ